MPKKRPSLKSLGLAEQREHLHSDNIAAALNATIAVNIDSLPTAEKNRVLLKVSAHIADMLEALETDTN